MPHCRFALHSHILRILVHVEHRLRRIRHAPHYHRRDLDRVPTLVVHLQLVALEISRPQRNRQLAIKRIGPVKSAFSDCPLVTPKQKQHPRLVRLQREEAKAREHKEEFHKDRQQNSRPHIPDCVTK
jgi:hypothetical protein